MKYIGKRLEPEITFHASSHLFLTGAMFNDEIQKLTKGKARIFRKGVYAYTSHEEANKHWEESMIEGIRYLAEKHE